MELLEERIRCESPPLNEEAHAAHSVAFNCVTELCNVHQGYCCTIDCCVAILLDGFRENRVPIPDLYSLSEFAWKLKRARLLAQLEIGLRVCRPSTTIQQYTESELMLDDVFSDVTKRLDDNRRFCSAEIPIRLQERVERAVIGGLKMHLLSVPYIGVERMLLKLSIDNVSFDVAADDVYSSLIVIKKQMDGVRVALFEVQKADRIKDEKQKKNKNEKQKKNVSVNEDEYISLTCCMCRCSLQDCTCGSSVESQGLMDIFSVGGASGGDAIGAILAQLKDLNANLQGLDKHVTIVVSVVLLVASIWASIRFIDLVLHKSIWEVVRYLLVGIAGIAATFGVSSYFITMLMSTQQSVGDAIESQSGFDLSIKPLSGLMVALAAMVAGVKSTSGNCVESLFKSCETFKRRADGLDSVRVWLIDFFEWAINFVRVRILRKAPICLQRLGDSDCSSWVDKTMEIVEAASKEKFPITVKNAEVLAMHILAGKELQATLMKKGASTASSGFAQFSRLLEYLKEIEGPFKRACCTMSGLRVRPTIVLLSGAPGVGKTQVALPLICRVGPSILAKEDLSEFQKDYMHYVYVRNAETKYWDGYAPHKIFMVIDDFMQARDVAGNPDNEIMDIIRCGSAFPNMLHMADLADKGNTMFRSQIVLCTSNTIDFKPNSIVEPEALNRRFDIMVKVVPKSEFCTVDTADKEIDARRLDTTKVDGVCDTNVYEFHLMKYVDGKLQMSEVIDYVCLATRIIELGKQRQVEFEQYTKRTAEEIQMGIVESQGFWSNFQKKREERRRRDDDHKMYRDILCSLIPRVMSRHSIECFVSIAQIDQFIFKQSLSDLKKLIDNLMHKDPEHVMHSMNYVMLSASQLKPVRIMSPGRMTFIWNDIALFKDALYEWIDVDVNLVRIGAVAVTAIGVIGIGVLAWKVVSNYKKKKKVIKTGPRVLSDSEAESLIGGVSEYITFYSSSSDGVSYKKYVELLTKFGVVEDDYMNVNILHEGFYYYENIAFYYSRNPSSHEDPTVLKMLEQLVVVGKPDREKIVLLSSESKKKLRVWTWRASEVYEVVLEDNDRVRSESESYTTDGGTRYVRDVRTQKFRKANMARGGHIVRSEMDWNASAHSQALPSFGRNTCHITSDDENRLAGIITFLTDRYFMINTHYYYTFIEDKDKCLLLKNKHRQSFKLPVSTICNKPPTALEIQRDWMIRKAPLTVQPFRNIVDMFIDRGNSTITPARMEVSFIGLREGESWTNSSVACIQPVKVEEPRQLMIHESYAHNTPTTRGDCGSWLIYSGPKAGNLQILGIHAAGTPMGPAYACCVYRDDLISELTMIDPDFAMHGKPIQSQAFPANLTPKEGCFNGFDVIFECIPGQQTCDVTEKTPSRFQNSWGLTTRKPAKLRPFEKDGVMIDPLAMAISKYSVPPIKLNQEHLAIAANEYLKYMETNSLRTYIREALSYEVGVLGFPGMEYHNAVQRQTSAGFPFSLYPVPHHKGKESFFGKAIDFDLTSDNAKELEKRVKKIIRYADKGIRMIHVFTDNLKDELRPIAKADAGKTRLFSGAPLDYTIAVRMYYLDFMAWVMTNRILNGIAVGVNPYSVDWTSMVAYLSPFGEKTMYVAGDFSSFDAHLSAELLIMVGDIVNAWYRDGNDNIRNILWQEVYNSRHIAKQTVYEWRFGLPSGHPMTTIINCISNQLMFRCAFMKICPGINFDEYVRLVVYGDDNIMGISPLVIDRFNQESLTKFFAKAGIEYTMEDKNSTVLKCRELHEVTFLKRGFVSNVLLPGTYLAPLDIETILDIPRWTNKGKHQINTELATLDECLNELSIHGEDVYMKYAPRIFDAASKYWDQYRGPVHLRVEWATRLKKVTSLDKVY